MHMGTTRKPKLHNVDGHRQSIPTQNKPNIANHNLILLKQFYLTQQHKHYSNIITNSNKPT
jgi:hypothetical protein